MAETANKALHDCKKQVESGDYQHALNFCTLQWPLLSKSKNHSLIVSYYLQMIDIHHYLENSQQENKYLAKVKRHSQSIDLPWIKYELARRQGRKALRKGQYSMALEYFNRGLQLAESNNNITWLSKSHNDVGTVYRLQNHYPQSINHYTKSLTAKRQLGNLYMIGTTQRNIGIVHTHLEEHEKALYFYHQALESYQQYQKQSDHESRVDIDIAHLYQDIALAYLNVNNIAEANVYKQRIINHYQTIPSIRGQTMALMNIAKLDLEMGLSDASIQRMEQAIDMMGDNLYEHTPELYNQLAWAYAKLNKSKRALTLAKTGLKTIQTVKDLNTRMQLHQLLAQLYRPINDAFVIKHLEEYQKARELFLTHKYNQSVKTQQYNIELAHKELELAEEKFDNLLNNSKIAQLRLSVFVFLMLFFCAVGVGIFIHLKRKQERQQLLKDIKSHRQQLLLLNEKQNSKNNQDDIFRKELVETMNLILRVWEKHTGADRVDLANQSTAWTVTVDNGTLRTRSFDKYLSLSTLPKFPRWKNVIKTCHFILSDETLSAGDRKSINNKLDLIMQLIKQ